MSDLISRQAAIDAIREDADWCEQEGEGWQTERRDRDTWILEGLPSAQSERKTFSEMVHLHDAKDGGGA